MQITVKMRIWRLLRRCRNYFAFDELAKQRYSALLSLNEYEEIYGVYKNPAPSQIEIIIGDRGLHILENDLEHTGILYRQIADVKILMPKLTADRLTFIFKDGTTREITVAGKFEETSDVYLFLTFIRRVTGDLERNDRLASSDL